MNLHAPYEIVGFLCVAHEHDLRFSVEKGRPAYEDWPAIDGERATPVREDLH